VLVWVKLIEAVVQLRPKSLLRLLAHPDRGFRAAMRWYYSIGRRVWPYELWHWCFHDRRTRHDPALAEFWIAGGAVRQTRCREKRQPWPIARDLIRLGLMDKDSHAAVSKRVDQLCQL
jgi:anaerobic magnesium-protoporphyrin IX monomethyl ester cyclase